MLVLVLISCFNSCYSLNPTCWLMPIMCTMRRLGCGAAWLLAATATAGSPSSSSLSASAPYPAELCSLNGERDLGGRCSAMRVSHGQGPGQLPLGLMVEI